MLRGLVLLAASIIAGLLWDRLGPQATFGFASVLALVTIAALWLSRLNRQTPAAV